MGEPPRKLTLEIETESDPITGRLHDEHGTRTFTGWLQLAAALEAARDPRPTTPPTTSSEQPPAV